MDLIANAPSAIGTMVKSVFGPFEAEVVEVKI
jgi:hypothetical protein